MDKSSYETFEFLPANRNDAEAGQFFVVQDDGTFLLNRQIQYVAQVQDVKEVLQDVQPCAVYGVSSQQFYVDVDNSTELISVSDQFILPDGDNSLYTNSYLLQPSSSTTTEQMEEDVVVDQFKQPSTQDVDIDVVTHNSKQGNNFTEITLSDEQYQTLEQKGWILLESNDKIFVLNTLGLHDITTNDKLIQKLKSEIQNNTNTEVNTGTLKIENVSSPFPNIVTEPLRHQQETVEFVISNDNEQNETIENVQFIVSEQAGNVEAQFPNKETTEIKQELQTDAVLETDQQEIDKDKNSIKIKTKFNFKDIPEKIILGKSANGKQLVAKLVKPQPNQNNIIKPPVCDDEPVYEQINENQHYSVTGLHESEFVNLIQTTLRADVQTKFNEADIVSAETVISQLVKVPNLKQSLIGHNVIVTKTTNNKDEFGTIYNRNPISLLTGRVTDQEDESCGFELVPNLLQSIKISSEEQNVSQSDEAYSCIEEKEAKENFTIFHVHISETKCADNVVRVSVTLNKRQLPINMVFDLKRRYPSTVYACSACAALFKSEQALKDHQESQCMDADDVLTIDTNKVNNIDDDVIIVKSGKEKIFSCGQCDIKFTKLSNIQRHMKSHQSLSQQTLESGSEAANEEGADTKKQTNKIYRCKMCTSTYFHSASLSKHIVNMHIKMKSN